MQETQNETAISEMEDDLAILEDHLALARYRQTKLDTEYKKRRDAHQAAFAAENKGLLDALEETGQREAELFGQYEAAVMRLHAARVGSGDDAARVSPCAEVKLMAQTQYYDHEALAYLVDHRLTQFLQVDKKAFEKASPHLWLTFVSQTHAPKLYTSRDMVKALKLKKDDLAPIDAEVEAILNPPKEEAIAVAQDA
ncbi:MAG: hypothetical protein AB7U82_27790 [Blastocatellales bacterium]